MDSIIASETGFATALAAANHVIVEFTGPDCIICKKLKPMLAAAATRLTVPVSIVEADASRLPGLADKYAIRSVPTLILFHSGEPIGRHSGFATAAELLRWIEAAVRAEAVEGLLSDH